MCGWKDVGNVIRKSIAVYIVPTLFGYFLGFHPYMFFHIIKMFFRNLFLLFFWGKKSVDGCVHG